MSALDLEGNRLITCDIDIVREAMNYTHIGYRFNDLLNNCAYH